MRGIWTEYLLYGAVAVDIVNYMILVGDHVAHS